ncbi:MAG: hypothetical protein RBU45_02625 [Myxococcota bacterium]|nr:hypothetical protein [Myxococcota bacterium]
MKVPESVTERDLAFDLQGEIAIAGAVGIQSRWAGEVGDGAFAGRAGRGNGIAMLVLVRASRPAIPVCVTVTATAWDIIEEHDAIGAHARVRGYSIIEVAGDLDGRHEELALDIRRDRREILEAIQIVAVILIPGPIADIGDPGAVVTSVDGVVNPITVDVPAEVGLSGALVSGGCRHVPGDGLEARRVSGVGHLGDRQIVRSVGYRDDLDLGPGVQRSSEAQQQDPDHRWSQGGDSFAGRHLGSSGGPLVLGRRSSGRRWTRAGAPPGGAAGLR